MLNLLSSTPAKAASTVTDSAAAGGDSPLTTRASAADGEGSGNGRASVAGKLFAGLFAAALGGAGKAKLAGTSGNDLPGPELQIQELGSGMQLLTPVDSELPQEDALFAFAVSQGLDAGLVASVLWPLQGKHDSGLTLDGATTEAMETNAAAAVAALLAGVVSGQVSAADGSRAGASLIMSMGVGQSGVGEVGAGQVGAVQAAVGQTALAAGQAPQASSGSGMDFQALLGAAGVDSPVDDAAAKLAVAMAAKTSAGVGFAPGNVNAGATLPLLPERFSLGQVSGGQLAGIADPMRALVPREPREGELFKAATRGVAADANAVAAFASRVTEGVLARAGSAMPAQWVFGAAYERDFGAPAATDSGIEGVEDSATRGFDGKVETNNDATLGGTHHRTHSGAAQRDGAFKDVLDLAPELAGSATERVDDSALAKLSRKFSEGIAQRMVTALSNDNWKVRLDLKPAHLGQVSVDMNMAQGRIEAVFDATNPAARALISESLERLRQDLQKSGMNVAYLSMNSGSSGGHAGKSTSHRRDGTDGRPGKVEVDSVAGVPSRVGPKSVDGLDILV